jgi:DNA-binding transcriptional MerR regulator
MFDSPATVEGLCYRYRVTKRTLNYYSAIGLLPKARRIEGSKQWGYYGNAEWRMQRITKLCRRPTLMQAKKIIETEELERIGK